MLAKSIRPRRYKITYKPGHKEIWKVSHISFTFIWGVMWHYLRSLIFL